MQAPATSLPPGPGPGLEHNQALAKPEAAGQQSQEQWRKMNTVFTNAKAGMAGVDKEHVQKVVYEMSKNSPHFKNEQRKQKQTDERIANMKQRAQNISQAELVGLTRAMDAKVAHLETTRDLSRTWLTVDMDAFFAACEELDNPALKTQPMAVGGIGMISTANYVARKYGVRSAMPGFIARELCPQLVFAKPNFSKYTAASRASRVIFADYDAEFSAGSLDEAHLDVTDYCCQNGVSGADVAEAIRRRMRDEVKLTCSVGVGPNRFLSKVAADMNKPDGQYIVPPDLPSIKRFVAALPIRKVPGIGKVAEQTLAAFGVNTCQGLLDKKGLLAALYSSVSMDFFLASGLALGQTRHSEPVAEGEVGRKGISCERTFGPISKPSELEAKACELAEKLAEEMADEGLKGKTLTLKLKETTFELRTRAHTCPQYISSATDIRNVALRLLKAEMPIAIRLMGLRMSSFQEIRTLPGQRSLSAFIQPAPKSSTGPEDNQQQQQEGPADPSLAFQQAVQAMPDELQSDDETTDFDHCHSAHHHLSGRAAGHMGSSAPVAAAGDQKQPPSAASKQLSLPQRHTKARVWECQVCTFSDNPSHLLRCTVCDSRRGSRHFDAPAGSQAMSRAAQPVPGQQPPHTEQPGEAASCAANLAPDPSLDHRVSHSKQPGKPSAHAGIPATCTAAHLGPSANDDSSGVAVRGQQKDTAVPAEPAAPAAGSAHASPDAQGSPGPALDGLHPSSENLLEADADAPAAARQDAGCASMAAACSADVSSGNAEPRGSHWECPRCGCQLPSASMHEHEDFHAAQDLQAEYDRSEDKWREALAGPASGHQHAAMPGEPPPHPATRAVAGAGVKRSGSRDSAEAQAGRAGQKRKRSTGHARNQQGGIKSFLKGAA